MLRTPMLYFVNKLALKIEWRRLAYVLLVTLPVVVFLFKFSFLYRNGIFRGEDWDYFAQSYEAARQSIVNYHQFPWWNPWMNGGQPLFANPQFGLFSVQMPLVLIFGTVPGLHYSIFIYFVLGFWGMYLLLQRLGSANKIITVLLSYIWLFSSFTAWHLAGGQLTFAVYLLAPWALLTALNIHKKWGWLWFGLVASLMIQTAMHYLTIQVLVVCALIAAIQVGRQIYRRHLKSLKAILPLLKPYLYSFLIILALCGIRLAYTLQFTKHYPRLSELDPPQTLKLFVASLTSRGSVDPSTLMPPGALAYGWSEYANYIGIITLGLFVYLAVRRFMRVRAMTLGEWTILAALLLAGLLTFGAFASFSPFSLLHNLPVFNQMRVPSRFIGWVGLGIILFLIKLPKKPLVYALLTISAIDVFIVSYPIFNYPQKPYQATYSNRHFEQYEFFQTDPSLGQVNIINLQNFRLLRATQNNYGEVYGYEPILNVGEYYFLPGTDRCGINKGCDFVLTNNAMVTNWSPHKISLKRTGAGPIRLNMNPGKVWKANNKTLFPDYKVLELKKEFIIDDPAQTIDVTFSPAIR